MKNADAHDNDKNAQPGHIVKMQAFAKMLNTPCGRKQIDLKSKSDKINQEINCLYPYDEENLIRPLFDGIINIEYYLKAKYKILWILKEPYDHFNKEGNACCAGWDINRSYKDMPGGTRSYCPMIYTTYSILNDFCPWNDIPAVPDDPNVFAALKSFAYINIRKMPGSTISSDHEIKRAYLQNREVLLKQISVYEPDIVIGGGTLNYFLDDLWLDVESGIILHEGCFPYYVKGKQLFIAAHHPSAVGRYLKPEEYFNNIIDPAKKLKDLLG